MSTNFPTSLDSYTAKIDNVSTVLATSVNNLQDAIEAMQTKVGRDGSLVTSTFDYRLGIDAADPFFNENVRGMYFFQNTAPTGWSVAGIATNCVIAVKGGAQAWNSVGATRAGTWTLSTTNSDTHNHIWHYYNTSYGAPYVWTFKSDGSTYCGWTGYGSFAYCGAAYGMVCDYNDTLNKQGQWYCASSCYTKKDTHSHTFDSSWRPSAAIGIVAVYTGS